VNLTLDYARNIVYRPVEDSVTVTSFSITSADFVIAKIGMTEFGQLQWQDPAGVPLGAITLKP